MSSPLVRFWDDRAADYDSAGIESAECYWRHTATNVLLTRCEVGETDVILDLGCGTGNVAKTLAAHVKRVVGLDISPKMLDRAQQDAPSNVEFRKGDLRRPPHVLGLTHITACYALTALTTTERRALWDQAWRMLKPGGMMVVADLFWTVPPEQVEADFFEADWMQSVSATDEMEFLERDGRVRVLLEPLHPLVSVLTAARL